VVQADAHAVTPYAMPDDVDQSMDRVGDNGDNPDLTPQRVHRARFDGLPGCVRAVRRMHGG